MANADLFDVYFRRADLDRDGRISGTEAVTFLQASGLPRQVLAQVWTYADQNRIGFLGRAEFYNALKLVTVAQKNKELTPDIVRAALFSPASAKIPAPQINLSALPAPQSNASAAARPPQTGPRASVPQSNTSVGAAIPQMGTRPPMPHQNPGLRGPQALPSSNVNPQLMSGYAPRPVQGAPGQGLPGGVGGAGARPQMPHAGTGMNSHMPDQGMMSSINPGGGVAAARPPRPPAASTLMPQDVSSRNIKASSAAANGTANTSFGGDAFSSMPSQIKQGTPPNSSSAGNIPGSAGPGSAVNQPSVRASPNGGQFHPAHSHMKQVPSVSAHQSAGLPRGANNSEMPWPKITQSNIQKYTKVFLEVDKDRDGKITGEEARNLFLSWRLPREVLKQVWDLSDQDNDSMLSHKEFCIALYLMERFREGRHLPAVLPSYITLDFPTTSQIAAGQANAAWRPQSGWQQQQIASGVREKPPTTDTRQPLPLPASEGEDETQAKRKKSRVPVLEKHLVDQLSKEEQESLNSKFKEATEAEKKVEELEKEIVESRQKIEFYHAKMQELILYKSRCDNRLNEITERVSADKREVEVLAKKYEEKYKQSGDVASRLTIEEATFRDIQEKKMEIYQAIVKMELDGSGDGVIKGRADHIQLDLDELVKALNDRCKKYGLRARPTAIVELPFGWQPGIQEGTADWDEDWDKFEDEGYYFVKELTLEVQNVVAPPKPKITHVKKETAPVAERSMADEIESEKAPSTGKEVHANGTRDSHAEGDSVAPGTPSERAVSESTSREDSHFEKSAGFDASPHGTGSQSEHGGTDSVFSGDKSYDEPAWGTFDTSDDVDSVWGINSGSTTKGLDHDNHYLFDSGALGLNPIKTGMPKLETFSPRKNTFAFDESVPSPPATGLDGFFPKQSTFGFDESVPSTPATVADGYFPRQSTFGFDESVPSTPATGADGFFPKRSTFGFDESVPSTPATGFDDFFTKRGPFGFDESVPSTPATGVDGFFPKRGPFGFDESVPSTPAAGADGFFPQRGTFGFDESVPSTPAYGATAKGSEYSFDSFSRFDSFNSTHDSRLFQSRETLSQFDSMRSTSDFDHGGNTFARFDSMRSTADFDHGRETLTRFDSMRSTTDFDNGRELGRFDSMRSTKDFDSGHGFSSFDDSDPFGSSGPFKISFDSQTPKKGSDNWNAF